MYLNFRITGILFLLLIYILTGCKKEKDEIPPVITIYSPAENASFDVLDSIPVKASVYDETSLKDITVGLVDVNQIPVLGNVSIGITGNSMTFDLDYEIDNPYLAGGNYFLRIRAWDGENYKNFYRRLLINALPRELKYIITITKVNAQKVDINKVKTDMTISKLFSINNDYIMLIAELSC